MNFGMLSPGGRGAGGGGRGGNASPVVQSPRESVHAQVYPNKIVAVELPYGTPRAAAIRLFSQSRVLTPNGQRALVWRRETMNKWTNISLTSSADNPILTMEPVDLCELLTTVLPSSPDVSSVVLHGPNNAVITMDEVRAMPFEDVEQNAMPAAGAAEVTAAHGVTNEAVRQVGLDTYAKVEEVQAALKHDIVQLKTTTEQKLNYIIDVLEGRARPSDPARRNGVPTWAEVIDEAENDPANGEDEEEVGATSSSVDAGRPATSSSDAGRPATSSSLAAGRPARKRARR